MAHWTCEGTRREPLPFTQEDGLCVTHWVTASGSKMSVYHSEDRVICPVCHEPRKLLKDGMVAKHTRYVNWQEQQARGGAN